MTRQIHTAVFLAATAILGSTAGAYAATQLPAPGSEAWTPVEFPRRDPTQYEAVTLGDRHALEATSNCSASALVYRLENFDLAKTPRLSWEWKVAQSPQVEDARSKDGDDFAARVYVIFEFEVEKASLWERAKRRTARAIFNVELPGRALNYVWSKTEGEGQSWVSPFTDDSTMISLGHHSGWRREVVNVRRDYRRSFKEPPPRAVAIGLMSDSDNTCQKARAAFANFQFLSPAD